jgi:hypothetical protein
LVFGRKLLLLYHKLRVRKPEHCKCTTVTSHKPKDIYNADKGRDSAALEYTLALNDIPEILKE